MVNRIDLHDRVDLRPYPDTKREGYERRFYRRCGHRGDTFHAYTSLFKQETDGEGDPEDEQYLA